MRRFTIQNDNDANDSFTVEANDVQDAALEALGALGWRVTVKEKEEKKAAFYVMYPGGLMGPFASKQERNKRIIELRENQQYCIPLSGRHKFFKLDVIANVPKIYR